MLETCFPLLNLKRSQITEEKRNTAKELLAFNQHSRINERSAEHLLPQNKKFTASKFKMAAYVLPSPFFIIKSAWDCKSQSCFAEVIFHHFSCVLNPFIEEAEP